MNLLPLEAMQTYFRVRFSVSIPNHSGKNLTILQTQRNSFAIGKGNNKYVFISKIIKRSLVL